MAIWIASRGEPRTWRDPQEIAITGYSSVTVMLSKQFDRKAKVEVICFTGNAASKRCLPRSN